MHAGDDDPVGGCEEPGVIERRLGGGDASLRHGEVGPTGGDVLGATALHEEPERLLGRGDAGICLLARGERVVVVRGGESPVLDQLLRSCEFDARVDLFRPGLVEGRPPARNLGGARAGDELRDVCILRRHIRLVGASLVLKGSRIEGGHCGPRGHALPLFELHRLDAAGDAEAQLHLPDVDVPVERDEPGRR